MSMYLNSAHLYEAMSRERQEAADEIERLRAALTMALARLEDDFELIDNDRGPIPGGLEGAISRGEEPEIAHLRKLLGKA